MNRCGSRADWVAPGFFGALLCVALLCGSGSSRALAQRRGAWMPPVQPVLVSTSEGPSSRYQVVLALRATGDVEIVRDERLFSIEVTEPVAEGARRRRPRTHTCRHPSQPRRVTGEPTAMHAGDRWGVALDLRSLCWGRALSAIETGGTVSVRYGARGATTIARGAGPRETARELRASSPFALPATEERETSSAIAMAPIDVRTPRAVTGRVAIRAPEGRVRRAWIRPDRVRFAVVDPAGVTHDCRLDRDGAAAIPDLFARIGPSRPMRMALDLLQYCDAEVLDRPGIYEITPMLELDEDGSEWELDALTGTFTGATVPLRIRSGAGRYRHESALRELGDEDLRRYVP